MPRLARIMAATRPAGKGGAGRGAAPPPSEGYPNWASPESTLGCHSDDMTVDDPRGAHPVREPELVFAHVRARFGGAEPVVDRSDSLRARRRAGSHLPRLSAAKTSRALVAAGFRTVSGDVVVPADLRRDGTQMIDDTGTVLLETLALGRRFYGLYVEPTHPSHEQWAVVSSMFAALGARLDARLVPLDDLAT